VGMLRATRPCPSPPLHRRARPARRRRERARARARPRRGDGCSVLRRLRSGRARAARTARGRRGGVRPRNGPRPAPLQRDGRAGARGRGRQMTAAPMIHGRCDPRFAAVRDAFAVNFAAGREVGASFAATVEGEPVVDLWGGYADAATTRPWERDTIVNVFSTTKAMTALCAHLLVDRGQLDLDAPVARYWPGFAQAGKERITTRHLLTHTAGLAALRRPLPTEAL